MKITLVSDKSINEYSLAFAKCLLKRGHEVSVFLPMYESNTENNKLRYEYLGNFSFMLPFGYVRISVYHSYIDSVPCYFLSNNRSFHSQLTLQAYDEAQMISLYCHSVLESFRYINSFPDYIFTDSHRTAAIPILQKLKYHFISEYSEIKTLHYINSNQYGIFNKAFAQNIFGADNEGMHIMIASNEVNLTKGAILCSTRIFIGENAVNILYDKNNSVHHALVQFGFKIRKLNMGIDTDCFDPIKDRDIFKCFNSSSIYCKAENKLMLQRSYSLQQDENIPLLVIYPYKTRDVITRVMQDMMRCDIQVIILYRESDIRRSCKSDDFPFPAKTVCVSSGDIVTMKRIFAGSDMAVFGGVYSPYGNTAYIASAYGCVPILPSERYFDHRISYFNKITLDGNGYTYDKHIPRDLLYTLWDALGVYRHDKRSFNKLIQNCMSEDYSPIGAAEELEKECNN